MNKISGSDEKVEKVRDVLREPRFIENVMFREITLLHKPLGKTFTKDEVRFSEEKVSYPMTNKMDTLKTEAYITGVDSEHSVVVIEEKSTLDSEKSKEAILELILIENGNNSLLKNDVKNSDISNEIKLSYAFNYKESIPKVIAEEKTSSNIISGKAVEIIDTIDIRLE